MSQTELLVAAIKDGSVVDHITAGHGFKIVQILRLSAHKKIVTVGLNLPSRAMKHKDLIKVEGRELTPSEGSEVALFAPQATINIIRDYKIVKKFSVVLPKTIEHLIVCPNPKCITNNEKMKSIFHIEQNGGVLLTCNYCEKTFNEEDIQKYNI